MRNKISAVEKKLQFNKVTLIKINKKSTLNDTNDRYVDNEGWKGIISIYCCDKIAWNDQWK